MGLINQLHSDGAKEVTVLDHGCGQGAAVNFFHEQKCHAFGIDVSEAAIIDGKNMFPGIKNNLFQVDPLLKNFKPDLMFSLVTSIQTMYYLPPSQILIVMEKLRSFSMPRGIVYLTMMTTTGTYFENSIPLDNGMRHVKFTDDRISVDQHISFIEDEADFLKKFPMLEIVEVGQYLQSFRRSDFRRECTHLAITARWK